MGGIVGHTFGQGVYGERALAIAKALSERADLRYAPRLAFMRTASLELEPDGEAAFSFGGAVGRLACLRGERVEAVRHLWRVLGTEEQVGMAALLIEGVLEGGGRQLGVYRGADLVVALHRLELGEVELRPLGQSRPVGADLDGRGVAQAVARGLERLGELISGVAHCALARAGTANAHLVHRDARGPVDELLPGLVAEVLCHALPPWSESSGVVGGRARREGRVLRLLFLRVCWTPGAARLTSVVSMPRSSSPSATSAKWP